jgi:hypothetical protein
LQEGTRPPVQGIWQVERAGGQAGGRAPTLPKRGWIVGRFDSNTAKAGKLIHIYKERKVQNNGESHLWNVRGITKVCQFAEIISNTNLQMSVTRINITLLNSLIDSLLFA